MHAHEVEAKPARLAPLFDPPYYVVVFSSLRSGTEDGYCAMSDAMAKLAQKQQGYLGMDSARQDVGITASYWRDLSSIATWKSQLDHLAAQELGRAKWYASYRVRVARVERDYGFEVAT